jgi:hypothetical protein
MKASSVKPVRCAIYTRVSTGGVLRVLCPSGPEAVAKKVKLDSTGWTRNSTHWTHNTRRLPPTSKARPMPAGP